MFWFHRLQCSQGISQSQTSLHSVLHHLLALTHGSRPYSHCYQQSHQDVLILAQILPQFSVLSPWMLKEVKLISADESVYSPFLIWTGFLRWNSGTHRTFDLNSILQSLQSWMWPPPPLPHLYPHRRAWHHWAQCHHRYPHSLAHGGAGSRQPSCHLDKTHCPPNFPSCFQHGASTQSEKNILFGRMVKNGLSITSSNLNLTLAKFGHGLSM